MARKTTPKPAPAKALRDRKQPVDLGRALVEAFATNERINQVLLDLLDPAIWRAFPPCSRRRNIATSFAHIHNVRCMRVKMSSKGAAVPEHMDRAEITLEQARAALAESAAAVVRLIEDALAQGGHVRNHKPDVVGMVCAAITHEAHHRGQICHWARELGSPIEPERAMRLWQWDKLWREVVGG